MSKKRTYQEWLEESLPDPAAEDDKISVVELVSTGLADAQKAGVMATAKSPILLEYKGRATHAVVNSVMTDIARTYQDRGILLLWQTTEASGYGQYGRHPIGSNIYITKFSTIGK